MNNASISSGMKKLYCSKSPVNSINTDYHFLLLFGLPQDPVLYSRLTKCRGVSSKHLRIFLRSTGLHEKEIAYLLGVSRRTIYRRMNSAWLRCDESVKLFQVARAFDVMIDILGYSHRALVWFKTPQSDLDNQTPLYMCGTESGRIQVDEEVDRIKYSVY